MPALLHNRAFLRLLGTHYLSVFNDNAFKQLVLLLAVGAAAAPPGGGDLQARAGLIFALPYLLFSTFAGDFADRFSKKTAILATRWGEIGVMMVAMLALGRGDYRLGVAVLFLRGVQSAFFSPAKYGSLPQIVAVADLTRANGLFQSTAILGILTGTAAAGFLKSELAAHLWAAGAVLAAIAGAGLLLAGGLPRHPPADPARPLRWNPAARLPATLKSAAATPPLLRALLAHATLHLAGATFLFLWNEIGVQVLRVHEGWWSAALGALTLFMAAGALLAGRWSRAAPRTGLVPLGGAVLAAAFLAAGLGPARPLFLFCVMAAGYLGAGLFLVPVQALLQQLPPDSEKGRILGAGITLDWLAIGAASFLKEGLSRLRIGPQPSFLILAGVMGCTALGMLGLKLRAAASPR